MSKFDERAKDWDKEQEKLNRAKNCVKHLKEKINFKNIKNILDYGCGTGLIAFNLLENKICVLGLDSSLAMVEECNKKAKEKNLTNITAKIHNILTEDLPKNSFDLIITSMTLHHIQDLKMFFQKSFDSLRNGGYLCINDLEKEDGTFHKKYNNEGVYHFGFSKDELIKICTKIGFSDFDFEIVYFQKKEDRDYPIFNFIARKGSER